MKRKKPSIQTQPHPRLFVVLFTAMMLITIGGCEKEKNVAPVALDPIAEARTFFEKQLATNEVNPTGRSFLPNGLLASRNVDWTSAFYQRQGDITSVFVPVRFPFSIRLKSGGLENASLNGLVFLRMTDPGNTDRLTAEMLTLIPGREWLDGEPFEGGIIVEDWFDPTSNYFSSAPGDGKKPLLKSGLSGDIADVQAASSGCVIYEVCVGEVMTGLPPWQPTVVMGKHAAIQASGGQSNEICHSNTYCPPGHGGGPGGGDIPTNPPPGDGGGNSGGGESYGGLTSNQYVELMNLESIYKSRMTSEELEIYNSMSMSYKYAYLSNAYRAEELSASLYPGNTQWNGLGDAFRHAFFHALNSVSIGIELSKLLGDAHEVNTPQNGTLEKEMDLFNNAVGRLFETQRAIGQTPQDFVKTALEAGGLRYLTPLNPNGSIITGVTELKPTNQ